MTGRVAAIGLVALAVAGACRAPWDPDRKPCEVPLAAEPIDPAGAHHQYVVDSIDLPSSLEEAQALGLDLDCDPQRRPDNALGGDAELAFDVTDVNPDDAVDALVRTGAILHLLDVQTVAFDDAVGVGLTVRHGIDVDGDPSDNFSGSEGFAVDASRGTGTISGDISDGELSASFGTLPIAITFSGLGEPFLVHLVGARAVVTVEPDRLVGRIGGAVTVAEENAVLFPVFVEGFSRIIESDCTGTPPDRCCDAGSTGETLISLFDDCSYDSTSCDCVVSLDELQTNPLVSSLAAPDLDLFDEDGAFNPRQDGINDSLSVGIGFTAVPADVWGAVYPPPPPTTPPTR